MNAASRVTILVYTFTLGDPVLRAILTDPQFWIPVAVLAVGIVLLACL